MCRHPAQRNLSSPPRAGLPLRPRQLPFCGSGQQGGRGGRAHAAGEAAREGFGFRRPGAGSMLGGAVHYFWSWCVPRLPPSTNQASFAGAPSLQLCPLDRTPLPQCRRCLRRRQSSGAAPRVASRTLTPPPRRVQRGCVCTAGFALFVWAGWGSAAGSPCRGGRHPATANHSQPWPRMHGVPIVSIGCTGTSPCTTP